MTIPNRRECIRILEDGGVPRVVIEHVETVEGIAVAIARAINGRHPGMVDERLVSAGALLHDLGRARTHAIQHAAEGVTMAEERGLDPRLVEIIRRHVGAGLTPREAKALGLPEWDGMPRTLEEKIVCHADTLVGEQGRRTLKQTIKHIRPKGAPNYERRASRLHRLLSGLAEEDVDVIGPW